MLKVLVRLPLISAICLSVASLLVFAGWIFNFKTLTVFSTQSIPASPATALCFIVLGSALYLRQQPPTQNLTLTWQLLANGVGLVGGSLLLQFIIVSQIQYSLDLESWLIPAIPTAEGYPLGRMSPLTATLFILSSIAMLLAAPQRSVNTYRDHVAQSLGCVILLVASMLTIGYLYGAPFLYEGNIIPVAFFTATGFILLSLSLLCEGSASWIIQWYLSPTISSQLTRRLLPLNGFAILLAGWLHIYYIETLPYQYEVLFFFALTIGNIILIGWFTIISARQVQANLTRTESALRTNEAIFASFMEHSPVYVFFKDKDGRSLRLSKNFEQLLGKPVEEALHKTMAELFPGELATNMTNDDLRVLREGQIVNVVEEFNGRTYETTKFPIARDGMPSLLAGFTIDITERRQAEKNLRDSEARFRAVTETATEAIITINQAGQLIHWNRGAEKMLGYTLSEVIGQPITFMMPPRLRAEHQDSLHHTSVARQLKHGGQVLELTALHRNNFEFPIELSLAEWHTAEETFYIAIIRDITARKRAEQAYRESETKHRMLLDNLPQKIFYKNTDSVYVAVNTAYAADLGCPPQAIIGKTDEAFFTPALAQKYRADDQRVMSQGIIEEIDETYQLSTQERIVHTIKIPIRNHSNEIIGLLGIFWDITERKRAESALQEAQAKITLTAQHMQALAQRLVAVQEAERRDLSRELHDRVGQNLTGLNLNLSLIQSQLSPEVAQKIGNRLTDSSKLVEETIDHIRDVMGELRPAVLDDYGLTAALRWHAERLSARTNLNIKILGGDFAARWEPTLESGYFRIAQEALHNIIKHAHATQVTITLCEHPPRMSIADNGQGFADFNQRGWGLSIMRERAEALEALCHIESTPGQGTVVCVERNV